jgi:putative Ca2+/H+ antiporter (TMEM165/GDT1 family)
MAIAFMGKMAVAVSVGKAISALPSLLIAVVTSASFVGVAIALWRTPVTPLEPKGDSLASKAIMISFTAIFFSEWGDVGQVTAASMAARFGSPFVVWMGAVGAMVTKGVLAASIGAGVRGWIQEHLSPRVIRYSGVSLLLVLGVLSVIETIISK